MGWKEPWTSTHQREKYFHGKNSQYFRLKNNLPAHFTLKTLQDICNRTGQDIAQQGIYKLDNLTDIFQFQCLMVLEKEKNNCYSKYNKSPTISSNNAAITKGHDCN